MLDLSKPGQIYNIQRYSLHDGPGIRTTIFLKGCPLTCLWCHNPESQSKKSELMYNEQKCISCFDCVSSCPNVALTNKDQVLSIERNRCVSCGTCACKCPAAAIDLMGKLMTVEEVMAEVNKDRAFYNTSNGGVTISGGEPLYQSEFALELARAIKSEGYHLTLDTSGYAKKDVLLPFIGLIDLYLYDVKHVYPEQHKAFTGVDNLQILRNLKVLSRHSQRIWVRLPLIPSFNDSETHIHDFAFQMSEIKIEKVSLLPYHGFAKGKYEQMNQPYILSEIKSPDENNIKKAKEILEDYGLKVQVGG